MVIGTIFLNSVNALVIQIGMAIMLVRVTVNVVSPPSKLHDVFYLSNFKGVFFFGTLKNPLDAQLHDWVLIHYGRI